MPLRRLSRGLVTLLLVCGSVAVPDAAGGRKADKPTIVITTSPPIGFAPLRVVIMAELKGGADEQVYCPGVEWNWGDDTKTEASSDCDPYQPGKSDVKRRWTVEHVFDMAGEWRIQLKLKQNGKVVAQGSTTLLLRPGRGGADEIIR